MMSESDTNAEASEVFTPAQASPNLLFAAPADAQEWQMGVADQ
eukprot:CAMPEP_0195101210 /NCGR_PEP_ID=MMETSP0448-20130528/64975_1 /TAXON_ID=66468 /ORGANISM="Heterocapsa triquestra, Strain CCMP 448" /LENGTH=42 /DNA_ID= /DNA_START= /DNA_END= /DNA_ORIENTATION=